MTPQQCNTARELLTEAIQKSEDAEFNFRVLQFLDSLDVITPDPVPVVIREVLGSVQPIFGPRTNPLDDWNGGPA